MRRLVSWFVRDPVAANLLMILILVGSVFGSLKIGKEFFPNIPSDYINITKSYPGAGPTEVEEQIVIPIEEAIYNLEGVAEIDSVANRGYGRVGVEVEIGYDRDTLVNEIKTRVNAITTFPQDSEEEIVVAQDKRTIVMRLAVYGNVDKRVVKKFAQKIRDDIARLPSVESADLVGESRPQIEIELSELDMRRYGISFEQVSNAIRRSSINVPAGSIDGERGTIQLQARGQSYTEEDFREIVLASPLDGSVIRVRDVATVRETEERKNFLMRFNGENAVQIDVLIASQDPDVQASSYAVREYIENQSNLMPAVIKIEPVTDLSQPFSDRLNLLSGNALGGLVLVFIVLMLFLNPMLAFWVSAGIGIAYAGALWILPSVGVSINMLSMFAFLLILGIVVDDAIIVGESVYRYKENGYDGLEASELGTHAVLKPVTLAVISTMVLFVPMLFLPGAWAKAAYSIPMVTLVALSFSLIESLLILPYHLVGVKVETAPKHPVAKYVQATREICANSLSRFAAKIYRPLLKNALEWRYLTVLSFLLALSISITLVSAGYIKQAFFPNVPNDFIILTIRMPDSYPSENLFRLVERAETALKSIETDAKLIANRENSTFIKSAVSFLNNQEITIFASLTPGTTSQTDPTLIGERWIHHIGAIPEAEELRAAATFGPPRFDDFSVLLLSDDSEQLEEAGQFMKNALSNIAGVTRIRDDARTGNHDLNIELLPYANNLGISLLDVANQVRQGFHGDKAQRIARGRDDMQVMVKYPEKDRRKVETLTEMRVRGADGVEVPFNSVAKINYVPGYASIERDNRQRSLQITAWAAGEGIDNNQISSLVYSDVAADLSRRYPNVTILKDGGGKEQGDFYREAARDFSIALIVIYSLMAIAFKSYLKPLGILSAVPFGIMGALFGHLIVGIEFSLFSFLGVFAASGVVVNDNLVLIERISELRRNGLSVTDALQQAGEDRFRPIILTSITTFVGLVPILLETSMQAQFLIPMVTSLAFGVLFASSVTLLFVPCIYLLGAQAKHRWSGIGSMIESSLGDS
ncbi:MAG: efflux RND transporter permease subunit [Cellvibrionales bacterium TMED148]|nr:acriflavin resistance protein [Porticoccaceae bacterium]RPG88596.1 MAG: efflux RND transporter permease subunit [Cellvibrionales bacterium TMED148]